MKEKLIFEFSWMVKDRNNIEEIEFWGHDAGEFVADGGEEAINDEQQGE